MEIRLRNSDPQGRRMILDRCPSWIDIETPLVGEVAVVGAIDPFGRQDAAIEIVDPPAYCGVLLEGQLVPE